ncbi:release factor H-coupled R [Calocera cornea HHB12733]|uniref:3'-phosphate/5'-hydroxy nucleic acid ligase n=1 Tax=Calocera cornea HHB12733 TaxID=1353952 RepID=A0A165DAX0_9BASI|nr:release factor H-coupled R [Calocera cornea HHB12733]
MPAITLILNTNHTKQAVVWATPPHTTGTALLAQAQNKFRSKALATVFQRGGVALGEDEQLPPEEDRVWIAKGEAYAGPPVTLPLREPGDAAEVRIIAERSFVSDEALKQLERVASLPGVRVAVGMPDLHPGSRFPIGCALVADGVYPALIGSDIGCGISLYRLASLPARLDAAKLAARLTGLDEPWAGDTRAWLERYGVHQATAFDDCSLGTVGGGNHFAEVCRVESITDEAGARELGMTEDELYLMVHSGSRGLGSSILSSQTASSSYLPASSPALAPYLEQHDGAVLWACANRDLIAHRLSACLGLPGEAEPQKLLEVTHNSVTPCPGGPGGDDAHGARRWLHRKGAAPSDTTGTGIVPCPGSRGDFSWLLRPIGDGLLNAHSLAHGAGRLRARSEMHTQPPSARAKLVDTPLGSRVVCEDPALLLEERPEAYKAVEGVVGDMEAAGVAQRVLCLRPVVTYKCRAK